MRRLMVVAVVVIGFLGQGCSSSTPATGRTCAQLEDDYQQALSAAYACTPGAANQCQQAIPAFFCAGCLSYVNDATALGTINAQLYSQGCIRCESVDLCIQTGPWACVPTDGGTSGGQCAIAPPSAAGG